MKAAALALVAAALWTSVGATLSASSEKHKPYKMVELHNSQFERAASIIRAPSANVSLGEAEAGAARRGPQGRIISGEEAAPCQFPHQVAMTTDAGNFCGGSLIASRWVLTAAHCVVNAVTMTVYVGSNQWRSAPQQIKASRIFMHGDYNPYNLNNDIAILDLGRDVTLGDCVKVIELESSGCDDSSLDGVNAVVSGWGLISDESIWVEENLRWVRTRPISNARCLAAFNQEIVVQRTLCSEPITEGAPGTLCSGDSGGPLLVEATGRQIGINSFVSSAGCESGFPSGYARVPCFADWIKYVMTL